MNLLAQEEVEWRLKNRATWLIKGNQNTKFFQNYMKHQKNIKKTWEIRKKDGRKL